MFESLGISLGALIILLVWSIVWKAFALWKCGRNNQPVWFVVLLIIASVGILPIIYLAFFQRNKNMVFIKTPSIPKTTPTYTTKKKVKKSKRRK